MAVVVLFANCTKKDDLIPEPVIPFKVVSVSPSSSATEVKVSEKIIVAFSKKPSAATIKGDDFFLIGKDGNEVDCDFSFDGTATMTYTPKKPLNYDELYKVSLENSVADDKTKMSEYYKFQFTTEVAPLGVVSVTPADKTTTIKADSKIKIEFSKKPSAKTISGSYFKLTDLDGMPIEVTTSFDGTNTITYSPKYPLLDNSTYTIVLDGATAEDQSKLSAKFQSTFKTENFPFKVVSITPSDNATGVSTNTKVVIVFNKRPNIKVATGNEFMLAGINTPTSSNVAFDGDRTITITPTAALKKEILYSTWIVDLISTDGDKIKQEIYSFTTEK